MSILLFHINIFKQSSIIALCKEMGINTKTITDDDFSKTIGEIAGFSSLSVHSKSSGKPVPFTDEMMVFCALEPGTLDKFLDEYRRRDIPPVELKAVMTSYNVGWTPGRLCMELKKENLQI